MTRSILFVCTGNICRSPTAEGVFRHYHPSLFLDSAGTHDYHIGEAPDSRSIKHAEKRGFDLSTLRARKVEKADFERFDLIYAMDSEHYQHLKRLCPTQHAHKVQLMLEALGHSTTTEVPDPYYGNATGFEHVLDLVEWAAKTMAAR